MRQPRNPDRDRGADRGSAAVDFVLVGSLVAVLSLSVIQLAVGLHVRNTLIDAAASGARYATLADRTEAEGAARTGALISASLNAGFARDITVSRVTFAGISAVEVTVRAPLPVIGFIGPPGMLEVRGHAAVTE